MHPVNSTPVSFIRWNQVRISSIHSLLQVPIFPSFPNHPRCRLSQILYDPLHQVEYLSEIEEKTNSDISDQSFAVDDNDSCYDSMSEHRHDRFNLSQMNVSMDQVDHHSTGIIKLPKLPSSTEKARFHSTAINDTGNFWIIYFTVSFCLISCDMY